MLQHQQPLTRSANKNERDRGRRGSVELRATAPELTYTDHGDEDDEGLVLGTIFTVSCKSCLASYSLMIVHSLIPHKAGRQEPPRPPSPEPTIAVYETITSPEDDHHHHHHCNHDPILTLWNTISVRLVGGHPLLGHYLYIQFT